MNILPEQRFICYKGVVVVGCVRVLCYELLWIMRKKQEGGLSASFFSFFLFFAKVLARDEEVFSPRDVVNIDVLILDVTPGDV